MQKYIININLSNEPTSRQSKCKHNSNCGRFVGRGKCLRIVKLFNLKITFGNKTCFISLKFIISQELHTKTHLHLITFSRRETSSHVPFLRSVSNFFCIASIHSITLKASFQFLGSRRTKLALKSRGLNTPILLLAFM